MSTLPDVLKKQIDNIVDGLKFQELEDRTLPGFLYDTAVLHKNGKPYFIINKKIEKIVKKQFNTSSFNFFLSISDEKKYSIAYVILQKK